eukprot:1232786-Rhodomonas_salina.2
MLSELVVVDATKSPARHSVSTARSEGIAGDSIGKATVLAMSEVADSLQIVAPHPNPGCSHHHLARRSDKSNVLSGVFLGVARSRPAANKEVRNEQEALTAWQLRVRNSASAHTCCQYSRGSFA